MRISDWSSDVCSSDLIDVEDLIFRTNGSNLDIAIAPSGANVTSFGSITDRITFLDWYTASATVETFQFVNTGRHQVSSMTLPGRSDDRDTLTDGDLARLAEPPPHLPSLLRLAS